MATIKSVTIKNDKVKEAIKAKNEQVEAALVKIGLLAERYAKKSLTDSKAVDTGRLRNSVTCATANFHSSGKAPAEDEDYGLRGKPKEDGVYVGTNVEYAPYIEFGARSMDPRPYLAPAIEDHIEEYEKILEDSLKQ